MELIINENQYKRFYKILNEQPGTITKISSALAKTNLGTLTTQRLQALVDEKKLTTVIKGGKITNPTQILNNLKTGTLSTIDSGKVLKILFKSETDKELLNSIADYLIRNDKNFSKYRGKSKKYIQQSLEKKYGVEQSKILSDKIYKYNYSNIRQGFITGFKGSPEIYKPMFKNLKRFRFPTRGFTKQQYSSLLKWLATGTAMPEGIITAFRKYGLGPGIATIGGEMVKRYLYLTAILSAMKFVYTLFVDNTTPEAERDPNNWWVYNAALVAKDSLVAPDVQWVIPALVTWPILSAILNPIFSGNSLKASIDALKDKMLGFEKEIKKIEDKTMEKSSTLTLSNDLKQFKDFIMKEWGTDYNENNVEFYKEGDYFVVSDNSVNMDYLYIKVTNGFEYVEQ
jgi:hypothetical protein